MLNKSAGHCLQEVIETTRGDSSMEIRRYERTSSAEETRALGIEVGDFITFDPRVEINNGFIAPVFGDKACVAAVLAAAKALHDAGLKPLQTPYCTSPHMKRWGMAARWSAGKVTECWLMIWRPSVRHRHRMNFTSRFV